MNRTLMKAITGFHSAIYRLTGGGLMGGIGKAPVLLLTTTGRKSGKTRTSPLLYLEENDEYFVVASAGGDPNHPAWYLNLVANPVAEIQVKDKKLSVRTETLSAEEKSRMWLRFTAMYSDYDAYQAKTERDIPLVRLTLRAS